MNIKSFLYTVLIVAVFALYAWIMYLCIAKNILERGF